MKNIDWSTVQDEPRRPVPGGYAARITHVEDDEKREFLKIEWDFADGPYKGANKETFEAVGFWPMSFVQSYKQTALRFFKGFKTSVEVSNPGFVFKNDPQSLVGKFIGLVLGEEEYISNKGEVKTRLYVAEKRSGKAIREGDYKIPELKTLKKADSAASEAPQAMNFAPIEEDDALLPF